MVANQNARLGSLKQSGMSSTSGGMGKKLLSAKAMTKSAEGPCGRAGEPLHPVEEVDEGVAEGRQPAEEGLHAADSQPASGQPWRPTRGTKATSSPARRRTAPRSFLR